MSRHLERIHSPHDVRSLDAQARVELCQELREQILRTVSEHGGHLGASLGVVELTVALHTVFESPRDRLVWDVGHQAYAHKLLTGRADRFDTIRQHGGLSGFLRRSESPHDVFGAGHASTAISAALGMAQARDLRGERHAVVAIVGDGALTGGLAYEGLNNAGMLGSDLIVVMNDNSMSISPNVGALSRYLTRLRADPAYAQMKRDIERLMGLVPVLGHRVTRVVERVKDGLRHVLVPGAFFEALGFRYLGPIDGYDMTEMIQVLKNAREMGGPVLVHVVTEKGRGYGPAVSAPDRLHGGGPFDLATGRAKAPATATPSFSQVMAETLCRLARTDRRIVAITAAMADGTGLSRFREEHPSRFFDVGIAEEHAVTFAAGLASQGMRPVVGIYSTFMQRAYDQVIHDVGIQRLPVLFCLDRAGLAGEDGATHHGSFDLTYMNAIPGLVVAAPRDARTLSALMETALAHDGPMVIRYPKAPAGRIGPQPEGPLPIGKGEMLRPGRDAALIAVGAMVPVAEAAADLLAARNIFASVVDVRFLKPLDCDLILEATRDVPVVVTIEEGAITGGLGARVAMLLGTLGVERRLRLLGLPDHFIEHGRREELLEEAGLTPAAVAQAVGELAGAAMDAS